MAWYEKLRGIVGDLFQIGGVDGPQLQNTSGTMEVRDKDNAAMAKLRAAGIPATSSTLDDVPDLLDLRGRVADIEFNFNGASPPAPNANPNKFGFCHTTGGSYTAGDVVFDNVTSLITMPSNVVTHITSRLAVTGTVNLIADGFYCRQGATWTLKGDGTPVYTGVELAIEVPYAWDNTTPSSTTNIPSGARVTRVTNDVEVAFNDNGATVQVDVDGTSDENIMATGDSKLKSANLYSVPQHTEITAGTTGPVKVTVTPGSASAGSGKILVHYVTPRT